MQLAGLALICDRRGIIARQHIERLRVHPQTHVLGRDVQHAISIVGEMMQVRVPELLEQKVALGKSRQPFLRELLRFFLLCFGRGVQPSSSAERRSSGAASVASWR